MSLSPAHERLAHHMLADGLPLVYDLEKSQGNYFYDAASGETYLDLFSFFASTAIGHKHPVFDREDVANELLAAAKIKPSLADIYTQSYVEFVEEVASITPDQFSHHFFIEGGALAVENALKAAFDWKVLKNKQQGHGDKGSQIIHFKNAFHGRSGYTLSLTNTHSKVKTERFPQFDWPRIDGPVVTFPLTDERLQQVVEAEKKSLAAIKQAIKDNPHDICAIIIEPIQSEGGDCHFRNEFFVELRTIADEEDVILIFDEVQTGMGMTGKWWCFEHFDVAPDVFSFGKKMQVGGIAATKRFDEVDSVFQVSSRINSTFGGNLVDMVRAKWIIKTIKEENLLQQATVMGEKLLAMANDLANQYPQVISNPRGRGLLIAFDLPDADKREAFRQKCFEDKLLILGCGEKSIRFRPFLIFDDACLSELSERLEKIAAGL